MQPIVTYSNAKEVSVFKTDYFFQITITNDNGIEQSIKLPTNVTKVIKAQVDTIEQVKQQEPVQTIEDQINNFKPTIVRIDHTEDNRQIEIRRESKPKPKRKQTTDRPFESKLNKSQVIEIKSMLNDEKFMATYSSVYKAYKDIAQTYNVSYMCIQFIHRGVTWKHV